MKKLLFSFPLFKAPDSKQTPKQPGFNVWNKTAH